MRLAPRFIALIFALLAPALACSQELARLEIGASSLTARDTWFGPPAMELKLALTHPVPYRAVIVADPVRLIVDIKGVSLSGQRPEDLYGQNLARAIRWGRFRAGWSRIVIELTSPYRIASAGQKTGAGFPQINIALEPVDEEDFAPLPSATAALRNLPESVDFPEATLSDGLTVMLDPGHGGLDPGALAGGENEADLVLQFANELRPVLEARGIQVEMTRQDDHYVGLEDRMTAARAAGADLLLSLHADALPSGQAAGATVYVWNPGANDKASAQLVARHERGDLLSGVDLTGKDDELAVAIMDFARTDTQARSENFARFIASHMALSGISLHERPVQGAAFSVLKSPDIPSILLELGFISDDRDRANMTNPAWRAQMVQVLADAVAAWAADDAARKPALRK